MVNYIEVALNLSPGFKPYNVQELEHKLISFPGGDPHITITSPKINNNLVITHRVNGAADFLNIILANDAARRMGYRNIKLCIPYFPAARQDRVCNAGEPLTVKVFADLINGCDFDEVIIYGPHSEVAPALLNNASIIDADATYAKHIVESTSTGRVYNIICPDAGAGKRVGKIASILANDDPQRRYDLIRCEKIRDVKDGSLKDFFVQADDLNGAPSLILDDVVAYGGTFLGLAEKLRAKNSGPLYIFTSHADCQEGLDKLAGVFDGVFTTNSKRDYTESDKIKILKIELNSTYSNLLK